MKPRNCNLASVVAFALLLTATTAQAVTIDWVTVGNPGNAADQDYGQGQFGSVAYTYRMSTYEVTNDQYTEFLNAVATSDPNGVWHPDMDITRSGSDGNYTYTSNATFGPNPANWISFKRAMRFVNWLENGQPTGAQGSGTTEDGTYTISDGLSETRASGASFFLPSEDEWYKAAYYDPRLEAAGGPLGDDNYWLYPTKSDTGTTADAPVGGANIANYDVAVGYTTDVGAYTGTTSFYGGFDFGGNVWEWNEDVFESNRGLRGGSWGTEQTSKLAASDRFVFVIPVVESDLFGFRVASSFSETAAVPEPGTLVMGLIGAAALVMLGWRRSRKSTP